MCIKKQILNNLLKSKVSENEVSLLDSFVLTEMQNEEYVTADKLPKFFCVGIIDIVNSTKTVSKLSQAKSSRYYELFLNTMAKSLKHFNTQILKTMGDSLLFYFPDTCHSDRAFGFLGALECGFALKDAYYELNQYLKSESLPKIDFRISFDYGNLTVMKDVAGNIDLVGPTINTCSKINSLCPINDMIIGGDLYETVKKFKEYKFKKIDSYSIDLKHSYPVHSVIRKK